MSKDDFWTLYRLVLCKYPFTINYMCSITSRQYYNVFSKNNTSKQYLFSFQGNKHLWYQSSSSAFCCRNSRGTCSLFWWLHLNKLINKLCQKILANVHPYNHLQLIKGWSLMQIQSNLNCQSCSFCFGLKERFTLQKLAGKIVLDY